MAFNLIPRPISVRENGQNFRLVPDARIVVQSADARGPAELLAEYLAPATGYSLPVVEESPRAGDILLRENGENQADDAGFVKENHTLEITAENIVLTGANAAALIRGIQTLRQLFPPEIYSSEKQNCDWSLPGVLIEDAPAFRWRGMMLDVARHFFSVEEVCRMIELFAQHKINLVHIHLTDDQGWRVEIRRYPKLTEVGSIRKRTVIGQEWARPKRYDETPYGGFFTQDDIRKIVAFAARRHITLVPEIDMPGHMAAAICAYPELGNYPENKVEVRDCWGISYQILSPRKSTIEFMQNVLAEIMELFPSKFIHIGGDEARKDEWQINYEAQCIMAEHGLKDEHELQSYFIGEMGKFIRSRGRRMIGWDEILEGGLADGAAVMSWHGDSGAVAAARLGHDSVVASKEFLYFDYFQADPAHEPLGIGGDISAEKAYRFSALPAVLSEEEKTHILGGQAQLWSEYIPNIRHLEYMAFPRACVLAEKLWSPESGACFVDFKKRLDWHRARLANMKVNAHPLP